MSDDFDPEALHPEDVPLDSDYTSEMTRLRPNHDDVSGLDAIDEAAEIAGDAVTHDLEALVAERDKFKDVALRAQADFENFRKRIAAQGQHDVQQATAKLAEALLPVLDGCEAAYLQHPDEVGPLLHLLLAELKKQGLEAMHLSGQPFDPNLAEAVLHEPGDGEPVVSEVLRSGYLWKGKVLRPAMVKVRG
ncbi:MAG: GrpE protein [Actinomycetota bacterium]